MSRSTNFLRQRKNLINVAVITHGSQAEDLTPGVKTRAGTEVCRQFQCDTSHGTRISGHMIYGSRALSGMGVLGLEGEGSTTAGNSIVTEAPFGSRFFTEMIPSCSRINP